MILSDSALAYCEQSGVYEVYACTGDTITYYSYFGSEGFVKVIRNCATGKETRKHLRYKTIPKFLQEKYNYFVG